MKLKGLSPPDTFPINFPPLFFVLLKTEFAVMGAFEISKKKFRNFEKRPYIRVRSNIYHKPAEKYMIVFNDKKPFKR